MTLLKASAGPWQRDTNVNTDSRAIARQDRLPQNNQIVGANRHTQGDPRENDDLFSSEHANHAFAVINAVNSL
ncbi:hypothetical protein [Streptomyces sp. 7N604]|uniref:hypothetical protein n=1 Tax=Streptomyces sp. 7N604 TaxID=3457415 RepID=UPI003FD1D2FE